MKHTLSKWICLALALLCCFAFVACGGAPAGGGSTAASFSADKAPEDYEGEIIFWSWSEPETEGLAAAFNEVYPNITIKFVPVDSSGYLTKFQTALISKSELPDVALQEINPRGAMFALDCWENLEAAPYNFDRSIVFPQLLPLMTNSRDEVIGIERELNSSGMTYKRELADEYLGTSEPDEVGAMITDWDSLIALGAEVYEKSGGETLLMAGLSDISSMLKAQYNDTLFDGEDVYATNYFNYNLDILLRAAQNNVAGKEMTYSPSWNSTFLSDVAIMYPYAPWSGPFTVKPNDPDGTYTWGITTPPVRSFNWGGTAYGIPKDAKNKELAWLFIQWATTTDEGTAACEEVVGAIVSRQANYADGLKQDPDPYFGGQAPNVFLMEECAPTVEPNPIHQYDVVFEETLALMVEAINNNPDMPLDEAVAMAVQEVTNKLPATMNVI